MRPWTRTCWPEQPEVLQIMGKMRCVLHKYLLVLSICWWVQLGYEISFSYIPLCVLCHCMFSAPNIPLCFPKVRNYFSLHIPKCADPQLGLSVVNRYLWETKQMPSYITCALKRERKRKKQYLHICITLTQTTDFSTSSSPVSNEEWTAYKLSASDLFAVTWSFHRELVWSFVTADRVAENSAFALTELLSFSLPVSSEMSILFTLATLSLLFEWLKSPL